MEAELQSQSTLKRALTPGLLNEVKMVYTPRSSTGDRFKETDRFENGTCQVFSELGISEYFYANQ